MFNFLLEPRDVTQMEENIESDIILQVQDNDNSARADSADWEVTTEEEFL